MRNRETVLVAAAMLGCAIALSAGIAGAQDGRQMRETREPRVDPIPRDGNNSWCQETDDGGMECGFTMCGVDHESSRCETWVTSMSNEDLP